MDDRIYDLADLFKVFSDSTRIRILYVLMDGEKNVSDISEAVEMNQSAVSHQLKTLKTSHLVKVRRDG
ncbi:MAG: winged helix-turn-helix transcriptional regulator, partial [Lachnospiraceae bacterium]|nr:winged helix-turn-helix transcriptional regulator [Lachnospiraceae bacterium]